MEGKCSTHRNLRSSYKILFRKSEGRRQLAIYRYRGQHIIEMKCKEIGINWVKVAQFRVQ
jgi:hypothetical protein